MAVYRIVDDAQIKAASLHKPLPLSLHLYIWPYLIVWPVFLAFYLSPQRYASHIGGPEWTFVFAGSIITTQTLTWLTTKWNVHFRTAFTATPTKDVRAATFIKLVPVANAGKPDICPLRREIIDGRPATVFIFQKRRFLYDLSTARFCPLAYEIDANPKPLLMKFQNSSGLTTSARIESLSQRYGDNHFDIPVPTFTELFQEHAVAPFFVFQLFCVGLWLLDEYWYYSLFTLFMLVVFESTVVWQRQRTLTEFRGMNIKPYSLWAYRLHHWSEIQSNKLLPGDLISLARTKDDSGVACDMLLVHGSAIVNEAMLSGESTPVLKDSVQLRPATAPVDPDGLDKNAIIYGGCKVLQITHRTVADESTEAVPVSLSGVPPPPDNGAVAVVLKTGFETSQGSLVRTMIYATEHISANNFEALLFILFLLFFAIAASWYVWQEGVAKDRKRSKLLLDCVLIITSVVPPELPMELSLAVNTSLAALSHLAIFCTEPFRIPFAGRVDIACFDKTGTLTGDNLVVNGLAGIDLVQQPNGASDTSLQSNASAFVAAPTLSLVPLSTIGTQSALVLAIAHALVKLDDGEVVGEPMEKATMAGLGWTIGSNDTITNNTQIAPNISHVQICRRFQFSSALKRQSSVATVLTLKHQKKYKSTFVGVKGAPETIRSMLTSVPPAYDETFRHFTRNGGRVLALAFKYLADESEISQRAIDHLKREQVECDLSFAGFLVLETPLKPDAVEAVKMLNESSHRVVMITGDNPLTAVHVAKQVAIVDRPVLILDAPEERHYSPQSGRDIRATDETNLPLLVWKSVVDDEFQIPISDFTQPLDPNIIVDYDICVTGHAIAKFKNQPAWKQILSHAWVYARVSPRQKEDILLGMKDAGYVTLMCGDGTNDVGALKQADVGIALLNGSQKDLDRIAQHARMKKFVQFYEQQCSLMTRMNQPSPPVPAAIAHLYPPGPSNPHYEKAIEAQTAAKEKVPGDASNTMVLNKSDKVNHGTSKPGSPESMAAQAQSFAFKMLEEDDNEPPAIKLGDASVAAPFTSKLKDVMAIPNIIRQGRCTLVATIQMYKILALNCLISAYSLSVLYLDGIKIGDGQATISGIMMTVCFLSISRARPVEGLSKERPQNNIFNLYIIGSVLGQFAIHISTLVYISRYVQGVEPPRPVDLEGEFEPSLLNSAVYLLQLIQQISTFAVNYQGRPFRESISENKGMYYGLVGVSAIAFSCAVEFVPELNTKLRLVPFSSEFKRTLTFLMVVDYLGCWIVEWGFRRAFSDSRPKAIAMRRSTAVAEMPTLKVVIDPSLVLPSSTARKVST